MENINNNVNIVGEVVSDFEYSHEIYGEKFYKVKVSAMRTSGVADVIPVTISERLIDVKQSLIGQQICVIGQFRSYNKHEENGSRLILSIFARECEVIEAVIAGESCNHVELEGYICKEVKYRKTPFGREIADVLFAVNRPYGKSDYIPCICWGRNARYISNFAVGSKVKVTGRIQSREYVKKLEDKTEKRIAYEVSVGKVEVMEETNEE